MSRAGETNGDGKAHEESAEDGRMSNVKNDWYGSLNIASYICLTEDKPVALCNESSESCDGNGGPIGGG